MDRKPPPMRPTVDDGRTPVVHRRCRCGLPPLFAARTEKFPCPGLSLDQWQSDTHRQVSWLAGQDLMRSLPGTRFRMIPVATCPECSEQACTSRSPLTVAGTATDLGLSPSPHSLLSPCRTPARLCVPNRHCRPDPRGPLYSALQSNAIARSDTILRPTGICPI